MVHPDWKQHVEYVEKYLKGNIMSEQNEEILDNLEVLRGMVEAHPESNFNLETFKDEREECGTLYCTVGLAASQPFFQEKGLDLCVNGGLTINNESIWKTGNMQKLDLIFGANSFVRLFETRDSGGVDWKHPAAIAEADEFYIDYTVDGSVQDKELALWRLDRAIAELKETK